MIVRILSSSASFHGVNYNTDKIDRGLGELMKVAGFGVLQGMQDLRPEDYKNALKAVSALNKNVKSPQFHAAISASGKSYDKHQLTTIAEQWLTTMGYGNQPYLVVFHQDTDNNHVHVVSTRIDKTGKQINRDFEHIRAVQQMNKIMGHDEKHMVTAVIEKALAYRFSTIAQFKMILEEQGYVLRENKDQIEVIKFGKKLSEIPVGEVKLVREKPDLRRTAQLKAIMLKYAKLHNSALQPDKYTGKYSSDLAAYLKDKHGLVLVFHASNEKTPYGYSIIDHSGKAVYKGSEVLALKDLLAVEWGGLKEPEKEPVVGVEVDKQTLDYYSALLKAVLYNYPDIRQGLYHQGLDLRTSGGEVLLIDFAAHTSIPVSDLLSEQDYERLQKEMGQTIELKNEVHAQHLTVPGVNLRTDVDDEAVYGRKRRKKK